MNELQKLVDNCYFYETVLSNIYHSNDRGYKITIKNWDKIRNSNRYKKMYELVINWVQQKIDPLKLLRANYEMRNGEFWFDKMGHTAKTISLYWDWIKDYNVEKTQSIDTIKSEVITSIFYINRYCKRKNITPHQYFNGYMSRMVPDIFKHIKRRNINYYVLVVNSTFLNMCRTIKQTQGIHPKEWINIDIFNKTLQLVENTSHLKTFILESINQLEKSYDK